LAVAVGAVVGYACTPHEKKCGSLIDQWRENSKIFDIYFVTATFSDETLPYFPKRAYHYILASFTDMEIVLEDIRKQNTDRLSFVFSLDSAFFERCGKKLNYITTYFTKYSYSDIEICDVENIIIKRERVKRASLANIRILTTEQLKFTFPYSKNIVVLEVEGEKTHQSDQKYCERTRRDVARKGISLNNLMSFSILEKLK
jgi:5'(3')-deoxyribonucleotidase